MNTPTTNAIEIEGLVRKLDTFKLGPLTLDIPRGCFAGLIGENGTDKSTTMKLLYGILEPSAGNIRVLGNNPATNGPTYKARIGFAFNDLYLPENFELKHVEHFSRLLYGEAWHPQTSWGLAERFDLPLKRWIRKYSRSMKIKLGMVCTLSYHAELLILDEPTSGLDPVVRDDALDIIIDFIQSESHSVLFSSHIISDLQRTADYVAFIHKGKLFMTKAKNELGEKYALLQANAEQLASLAPGAILGRRHTELGDTVLIERDRVPAGFTLEYPSTEDIMVYPIRGEGK